MQHLNRGYIVRLLDDKTYQRGRRAARQFIKYCMVGASGFAVNLLVYSILVERVHMHYLAGASLSFAVAVTNNFVLNKYWTFRNPEGDTFTQAGKFLVVSITSLALNLLVLHMLVQSMGEGSKISAQAAAVMLVTALNFLGNKLWSFRQPTA